MFKPLDTLIQDSSLETIKNVFGVGWYLRKELVSTYIHFS